MQPMRVLIADDHRLFRTGLASMFASRTDFEVVGQAADGMDAVQKVQELRPDVVLLDVRMPLMNGVEALRQMRAGQPDIKVVMLTASEDDRDVLEALQAGAQGYLLKSSEPEDLYQSLRSAVAGRTTVSGLVAAGLVRQMVDPAKATPSVDTLTQREMEVLRLVADGATNKEIAAQLCITVNTVKNHLREILSKLHLENRTQAASYALRQGLVPSTRSNQTEFPR